MGKGLTYTPEIAMRICEAAADGDTLVEICSRDDMPGRNTVYRWLTLYPKFFDAYERAKELSAQSLEEEALMMARTLKGPNDFTSVKVQAYNIAMQQLRWSAARRNPRVYGTGVDAGSNKVPITINTTLNIGQDGPATDGGKSEYTISIEVPVGRGTEDGGSETEDPPTIDLEAEPVDNDPSMAFGEDLTKTRAGLGKRPDGRPAHTRKGVKGRRKSPAGIARTARTYAKQERKRLGSTTDETGT